ncbi:MAG: hypothetical protein IID39_08795 [Planctomycetes bacterium]|nr:hypothetical protein [Planctomycetota bacterium]
MSKTGVLRWTDLIEGGSGFWGGLGAGGFVFDPECCWDPHANRFLAMASERTGGRSYFLFAISKDDSPDNFNDWWKYRFDVTSLAGNDIDSPNMAVGPDSILLTADFFGPDKYLIFMVDKADVLVGDPPSTRSLLITGTQSYGIPVTYDADAPAQYMIQSTEFSNNNTVRFHAITDPLGNPQRVTTTVSVPNYRFPERPPQMGTSTRPHVFEPRFWSCVYRNGSLWAVHHQDDSRVRVRWYEFRMNDWPVGGTPELVQWGEIDPGSPVRTFFPSIWVDEIGNAVICCARSSPSEFISMSRAVRAAGDPPGQFQPIEFVKQSKTPYTRNRWGDYSGTASDPTQVGRFWIHHEYAVTNTSWNTWIAEVLMASGLPIDLRIIRGRHVAGELADLFASDDSRMVFQPGITLDPDEPPVWLELTGRSPSGSPSELAFTLETRVDTPGVTQTISLFNYDAGEFEEIDSRTASFNNDSTVEIVVGGDPSRFIKSDTLEMKAELTWKPGPLVILFPWNIGIDQAVWSITP